MRFRMQRVSSSGVPERELIEAVSRVSRRLGREVPSIQLRLAGQGARPLVEVVRRDSGETVRRIPSERFLDLFHRLERLGSRLVHELR